MRGKIRQYAIVPVLFISLVGLNNLNLLPAHAANVVTTYKLLWADDFSGKKGAAPNPKFWSSELGGLNSNGELEYYTKNPSNLSLDGKGHLVITANRIADQSLMATSNDPAVNRMLDACNACQFTSAKIKTAGKLSFQYGRIEIRMKTASGLGTWPAFWMLGTDLLHGIPWPDAGEIDVVETKGSMPSLAYGTLHGAGMESSGGGYGSIYDNQKSLADDFHTYAVEWVKNHIDFYVDDNLYFTATSKDAQAGEWAYNQPFFLILNLAMGGEFTGDLDPAMKRAQLVVDYIHYYSLNGVGKVFNK